MSATDFNDLIRHEEHEITIATYYDLNLETINVAIECMDCHEVLLDFDKDADEAYKFVIPCSNCGKEDKANTEAELKVVMDNHICDSDDEEVE